MNHFAAEDLVTLLRQRAQTQAERRAYTFLLDGEQEEETFSWSQLDQRARAIAARLQRTVALGDRVLLLYPPGLEYIAAFFGCIYAGAVAVPAYPPRHNRNQLRLQTLVTDAQAQTALTSTHVLSRVSDRMTRDTNLAQLSWISSDEIANEESDGWCAAHLSADSLVLLQYTSGSTTTPKGVMINHRNLLSNERLIEYAFSQSSESVVVGWLPLYHDMGLIGNVIQPLFVGAPCVLMSPLAFLQKPLRWLQAISHYRATTSGGPNFAYDLCVRKIGEEQLTALDLSSWKAAFNGAEPIRAGTLEAFAEKFAPCGFRREAFRPCYGLAEATLIVSGSPEPRSPLVKHVSKKALDVHRVANPEGVEDQYSLISSGRVLPGEQIRIANPVQLTTCAPEEVGEIWLQSASVAAGYWNNEEQTEETFRAYFADTGEGPFLRTGDLGFFADGELFVTGRLKDLIIIRGLNYYPQDIELSVERCHAALRPGCGAAFSVTLEGEERLVIAHELEPRQRPDLKQVINCIRQSVIENHELQVYAVTLIRAGTLPKTSSGKIQRHACRAEFLADNLDVLAQWRETIRSELEAPVLIPRPTSWDVEDIEAYLALHLAARLDDIGIDRSQSLAHYGLDSLGAIELTQRIESDLGIILPLPSLLEGHSIKELATQVQALLKEPRNETAALVASSQEENYSYSLSYGQRALWFLQKASPQSAAYNIASALRIRGSLNRQALRQAFQRLAHCHPSLRTSFIDQNGEPVQTVRSSMALDFIEEDASSWSLELLTEHLNDEAHLPFNLEHTPLLRVRLFRRSESEYVLLFVAHHIALDFWSLGILMRDLSRLYAAEKTGSKTFPGLPELKYTDYVRWQREALTSPAGESSWAYWEKQLEGPLPFLDLPVARPRPPVQTSRGAQLPFQLGGELMQRLKSLARKEGATLYMLLLAAYQVLLFRYTNQETIVVGSSAACRNRAELAGLVGYLVNPLVLRGNLAGEQSFVSFLSRVRQTVLEAFAHQDYPFPLLVERLHPVRDRSRTPLFQTMFVLHKAQRPEEDFLSLLALREAAAQTKLDELELESVSLEQRAAQFELTLAIAETENRLSGAFQYKTDLFDEETLRRMAEHYRMLLEGIVADPDATLRELPLLTAAEQRQIVFGWNDTGQPPRVEQCLHELFERQVEQTPEAIALIYEDQQLTYRELNSRANRLARHLRILGVRAETLVGVLVSRSVEMLVSLLSVLKAGAAYVPLDPQHPAERLSLMMDDAGVEVVLVEQRLADKVDIAGRAQVVCVDALWELIAEQSDEKIESEVNADNLAYVIYTSGSTGRPKGVMIPHRGLVNYLQWCVRAYDVAGGSGAPVHSSIGFDLTVTSLFAPLLAGRSVVLSEVQNGEALISSLDRQSGYSFVKLTPSHLDLLNQAVTGERIAGLTKMLILGGEALHGERLDRWRQHSPATRIINEYGPTETVVGCCFYEVAQGASLNGAVPIGRPVANTQVYVLDEYLNPLPPGIPGELFIGGIGLARGYLNNPDLTARAFIPHPFSRERGARVYRTGDRARYLPDGNIEFLGRFDDQVKLRGYRIELGEIETVLCEHAEILEAVVIVREHARGAQTLVAYFVSTDANSPASSELRRHLKEKLPEYMVPAVFVQVERMPLTANGKLDRSALLALQPESATACGDQASPRSPVEKIVAETWQQVLGVERVGIYDNFFALGGDSIVSLQIVSRLNQAGLMMTPQDLFDHQTVAELSAAFQHTPTAVHAEPGPVSGPVPLTSIQHWFFEQQFADAHHWNQAVMFEVREALDRAALERAISWLLEHHDALRLRFVRQGDGWQQFNAEQEGSTPLTIVELNGLSEADQRRTIELAASKWQTSLNLSEGPLVRAVYFEADSANARRLLLIIHHLAVDAVSWRILFEDLERAYGQAASGLEIAFARKTTSFKQWAERLQAYAEAGEARAEAEYWLSDRWLKADPLPVDLDPQSIGEATTTPNSEASANTVRIDFEIEETDALLDKTAQVFRTRVFEMLLAALGRALWRWYRAHFVLLDVESHGRESMFEGVNVSRTVGWFTTIYPVLLETGGADGDEVEVLKSVKEQLRQVPHHGIGYGALRYMSSESATARSLQARPRAQVLFNYLGQLDRGLPEHAVFRLSADSVGPVHSPQAQRSHLLEINSYIAGGRLRVEWQYSEDIHRRVTIERLSESFKNSLRALLAHTQAPGVFELTPADFPMVQLSSEQLEGALAEVTFDD